VKVADRAGGKKRKVQTRHATAGQGGEGGHPDGSITNNQNNLRSSSKLIEILDPKQGGGTTALTPLRGEGDSGLVSEPELCISVEKRVSGVQRRDR